MRFNIDEVVTHTHISQSIIYGIFFYSTDSPRRDFNVMTSTPSFSSFPERPKAKVDQKSSVTSDVQPAPSFDSFPASRSTHATTRKDELKGRKHARDYEDGRERKRRKSSERSTDQSTRHQSNKSKYRDEDIRRESSSKVERRDRQRSSRPSVQSGVSTVRISRFCSCSHLSQSDVQFQLQETTPPVSSSDWYTDTRGDQNNLRYGSLYAANVPRYNVRRCEHSHQGFLHNWKAD
jgi:hypothetical protein